MTIIKNKLYFGVAFLSLCAPTVHAADWFLNATASMGRIEPGVDGSIWVSRPYSDQSAITLTGLGSSCLTSQIHLMPPAGQEKAWLAVLLTAAAQGKSVAIFGECYPGNTRVDATRLVVDY